MGRLALEIARDSMARGEKHLQEQGFNLTAADISLIACIPVDGCTANIIARKLGITKQAVSKKVASLESRGFLQRMSCEEDGRAFTVEYTSKGVDALEAALEGVQELSRVYSRSFGQKRFADLLNELQEFVSAVGIDL